MNEDEFLASLAEIDGWVLDHGKIRRFEEGRCFCPITAVLYKQTEKYLSPIFPMTAAAIIKLDRHVAAKVVWNADNNNITPEIRGALLKACKLEEPTES